MVPTLHHARKTLSFPFYAADFDPSNPDFLLVGGGGGSSSTGVPNKLTLLDCSSDELREVADIELAATEDSVQSLAVAQSSDASLIAYAGVNGSDAEQESGRNEHFRSFRIDLPRKRNAGAGGLTAEEEQEKDDMQLQGQTEALGRAQFFKTQPGRDQVYQRLVRLSPLTSDASRPRVTAIATGMAAESEIVLLKAGPAPGSGNEIARLDLGNREAVDLDFAPGPASGDEEEEWDEGGTQYTMAYCTDYDVRLYRLSGGKDGIKTQMTILYTTPAPPGNAGRPRFRNLRFLCQKHILLVQNLPEGKGSELLILRMHKDGTSAFVSLQKRLGKNTKKATGLDVCILSASSIGDRQILIAVAGQGTIEVLRLDFSRQTGMSSFFPYTVLKDIHAGPITSIVFSTFVPRISTVTKDTRPPSVKLASVSVEREVVVVTFPLRPLSSLPSKTTRYVLVPPGNSNLVSTTFSIFMAVFVIGIAAFMLQVFGEIRAAVPPLLGASEWLPTNVKEMIARTYVFADSVPSVGNVREAIVDKASPINELLQKNEFYTAMLADATDSVKGAAADIPSSVASAATALTDLVAQQATAAVEAVQGTRQKAIVVRDSGSELSTEVHPDAALVEKETLKKWEDLQEHEKAGWRQRLVDAGHWTVDQGESVLKGVFFSELGAMAAQALG